MAETGNGVAKGAIGLIAGAILGAGFALLYAPQAGEKTRRDILYYSKRGKRKARGIARSFSGVVDTLGENAAGIVGKGKDVAHEAKEGVLEAIEEGKERLRRRRESTGG